MRRVIGRFSAAGSDGRAYAVEIVRTVQAAVQPGEEEQDLGPGGLYTTNGVPVTRVKRGEYRITGTDVTLTSSAHTAP